MQFHYPLCLYGLMNPLAEQTHIGPDPKLTLLADGSFDWVFRWTMTEFTEHSAPTFSKWSFLSKNKEQNASMLLWIQSL